MLPITIAYVNLSKYHQCTVFIKYDENSTLLKNKINKQTNNYWDLHKNIGIK